MDETEILLRIAAQTRVVKPGASSLVKAGVGSSHVVELKRHGMRQQNHYSHVLTGPEKLSQTFSGLCKFPLP